MGCPRLLAAERMGDGARLDACLSKDTREGIGVSGEVETRGFGMGPCPYGEGLPVIVEYAQGPDQVVQVGSVPGGGDDRVGSQSRAVGQ